MSEDVIEKAASARSKCRACGTNIARDELRFGESVPNPFADGQTTLWFHLDCAAFRRPEKLRPVLSEFDGEVPSREMLLAEATLGEQHPRLTRLKKVERAPSGRATCRHCRELIEKGAPRFRLEIFDDGRFNPMGYIHPACLREYSGADASPERLARPLEGTDDALRAEVSRAVLVTPSSGESDGADAG